MGKFRTVCRKVSIHRSLLLPPDTKDRFINTVNNAVNYNREIVVKSNLFISTFFLSLLHESIPFDPSIFTQVLFTSIYQLMVGNEISNTSIISPALKALLVEKYTQFTQRFPNYNVHLFNGNIALSHMLSSTTTQQASHLRNFFIESFYARYQKHLELRMRLILPVSTFSSFFFLVFL